MSRRSSTASGSGFIPRIVKTGSPGTKYIIVNTIIVTPRITGIINNNLLRTYLTIFHLKQIIVSVSLIMTSAYPAIFICNIY